MGAIRSFPSEQITSQTANLTQLNYVEASVCGWQHHMQDFTGFSQINAKLYAFFVVDGHGGPDLAEIAVQYIPQLLKRSQAVKQQQYKAALQTLFQELDMELKGEGKRASMIREKNGLPPLVQKYPTSGLSMVIALVGDNEITIANVGQCKSYVAYCSNPSKGVLISGNHTENNAQEESRVKHAGGFFLNGKLNCIHPFTRSIGDYDFKSNDTLPKTQQLLISTPSISTLRKQDMKTVILGSSGLWQQTQKVFKEITEDDCELNQLQKKVKELLQQLISKNPKQKQSGLKNMSLVVIDLKLNK